MNSEPSISAALVGGAVASYVVQRGIDYSVDRLVSAIIQPCLERRAKEYFRQLSISVAEHAPSEVPTDAISKALDAITASEAAREKVFEHYRQSLLARSRVIGPRILAILVAELIAKQRDPSSEDSQLADLAEAFTDQEFAEFVQSYPDFKERCKKKNEYRAIDGKCGWSAAIVYQASDSNYPSQISLAPCNLTSFFGSWAGKLERSGAITQSIDSKTQTYEADPENKIDMDGVTTTVILTLAFEPSCDRLVELTRLASPKS